MRTLSVFILFTLPAASATLTSFTPALPVAFEENRGQLSHPATHIAADHGWAFDCSSIYHRARDWRGPDYIPRIALDGANSVCQPSMALAAPTVAHYYRGPDRARWVESVQRFNILAYKNVAPGLDWQYQARGNAIEWRWDVTAGIDPASFSLRFENIDSVYTLDQGLASDHFGLLPHPVALQLNRTLPARWQYDRETKAARIVVDGRTPQAPVSLTIALPLVYLPVTGFKGAVDSAGNWLVLASSDTLASLDARSQTCVISMWNYPCPDLIVARFSPSGDLLSESHLSGSRYEAPSAIRSEPGGNIYVTGTTYSTDFPVTEDAAQREYAGPADMQLYRRWYPGGDAFVVKFYGPTGTLIHSTFAGGPLSDSPRSLDVDNDGRPTLLVYAQDGSYPTPNLSISAVHLNEPFSRFDFYLDSPGALSIRAGLDGSVWLLRTTWDGVVSHSSVDHISPVGDLLETLTLHDGLTATSFAVAPGPVLWFSGTQPSGQSYRPVLARLSLGGLDVRSGWPGGDVATDAQGNLSLLTGSYPTLDNPLPVTDDAVLPEPCSSSLYFARFTPRFELEYATFLLPANLPVLVLSPEGQPAISDWTTISLLTLDAPAHPFLACVGHTASNVHGSLAPASLITLRGRDIGPALAQDWQLNEAGRIATALGGVQLTFAGIPAPLLRVERNRVDAIIPHAAPSDEPIPMLLTRDGREVDTRQMQLSPRSFTVFRIYNEDGTVNSAEHPARLGSVIRLLGSGAGPLDPPGVDGQVGHPVLAVPKARLTAEVGRATLEPLRFQQAPDWPSGVMEALFRLPEEPPYTNSVSAGLYLNLDGWRTPQFLDIYYQ